MIVLPLSPLRRLKTGHVFAAEVATDAGRVDAAA
jgi:hypothetical protein